MAKHSTRHLLLPLGLLLAAPVLAQPAADHAQQIERLITSLATSSCAFMRNGEWHDAAAAATHLRRKAAVLLRRRPAATAQEFITLAASGSSQSGQAYQVRCGQAAPVASAVWLTERLRLLPASSGASRPR